MRCPGSAREVSGPHNSLYATEAPKLIMYSVFGTRNPASGVKNTVTDLARRASCCSLDGLTKVSSTYD